MKITMYSRLSGWFLSPFLIVSLSHCLHVCSAVAGDPNAFLKQHCYDCHDASAKEGGLDLESLQTDLNREETLAKWVLVHDRIARGEMPPPKHDVQPRPQEKTEYLKALAGSLTAAHMQVKGTVVRRLNRNEYLNTMEDLLGVPVPMSAREFLPDDTLESGFDNIGDALGMSDVQLSGYMQVAEATINLLLTKAGPKPEVHKGEFVLGTAASPKNHVYLENGGSVIFIRKTYGLAGLDVRHPVAGYDALKDKKKGETSKLPGFEAHEQGLYHVRYDGFAYQSDKPMAFALHSTSGLSANVVRDYGEQQPGGSTVEFKLFLNKGDRLAIGAIQDKRPGVPKPPPYSGPASNNKGPGLGIRRFYVEGPFLEEVDWPPRGLKLLFDDLPLETSKNAQGKDKQNKQGPNGAARAVSSAPKEDAARLLRGLATAAFRRAVTNEEVATYLNVFETEQSIGADFTTSLRTAAVAVLSSPQFLYLVEPQGKLDDLALASRLSYFLARTTPDAELRELAIAGQLHQPEILKAQTERLLAHANSQRFVKDFTDSWLNLRNIDATTPDEKLYPEFEDLLQESMLRETRSFFTEMFTSNLSLETFIKPDFAMLNRRLADHYGLTEDYLKEKNRIETMRQSDNETGRQSSSSAMLKVPLPPDSYRGGLLSHASLMKVSANGTSTSPVTRGVFVMERLLGETPPPPPPGIPGLEPDTRGALTVRQMLDKHRELASCNVCHAKIDPPGFALESFDVIGGWRDQFRVVASNQNGKPNKSSRSGERFDDGQAVDASGQLPDGSTFRGFADFQSLLLHRSDTVARCVIEKLLTFATGRELGFSDRAEIETLAREAHSQKLGLRDVLHRIVQSEIFRNK